jgi:shikimate dehydrogenase
VKAAFALLGYPLSHSFSKQYFTEKFLRENIDAHYQNLAIPELSDVRIQCHQIKNLQGFNVTIPHKTDILKYLDAITPEAEKIGAVNTVKVAGNKWTGYNTDVWGFERALLEFTGANLPKSALILGTGGAALAVKFVLEKLKIDYFSVSRTPSKIHEISYADVSPEVLAANRLIIQTTPLGMYPDLMGLPQLPYFALTQEHLLFDLVYNPDTTRFMQMGLDHGAKVCNGLKMLIYQAEAAWNIWNSPDAVQS